MEFAWERGGHKGIVLGDLERASEGRVAGEGKVKGLMKRGGLFSQVEVLGRKKGEKS